jgi:hypothetical protein
MRLSLLLLFVAACHVVAAQELYVFSEPASNMPAYTFSPRMKVVAGPRERQTNFVRYTPEVMLGLSKNLMVHGAATFSNMHTPAVRWEGAYTYIKYRFLSLDDVHRHFRMAAFAEGGYSRNPFFYDDISVRGDNTGVDAGLIATQLVNKFAVSATVSYLRLIDNKPKHYGHVIPEGSMNYALSAGYLLLPRTYKSYDQTNVNLYAEFLAQRTIGTKRWFVDAAPAIQFIFKSNARLNLGYRFQLEGNAERSIERSFLVSFEYLLFNVLRKK